MIKVAFVVYREWGYRIFRNILEHQQQQKDFLLDTLITIENPPFTVTAIPSVHTDQVKGNDSKRIHTILSERNIDIACFYSWSYMVGDQLLTDFICLCLHPSRLPAYRGGTPIQNQIMDGVTDSAITIFRMSKEVDGGDMYKQVPMSLEGNVHDIFDRMVDLGTGVTKELIADAVAGKLHFTPQAIEGTRVYKRRKPEQSEIHLNEAANLPFAAVNNLVRGLLDPYPNAFISLSDGMILIQQVEYYKTMPTDGLIITAASTPAKGDIKGNVYLLLQDGFAKLTKYSLK